MNQQVREHFEAEKNYHTWSQLPGEEKDGKPTEKTQTYWEKQAEELQKINYPKKAVSALRQSEERAFQVLQSSDMSHTKVEEFTAKLLNGPNKVNCHMDLLSKLSFHYIEILVPF